MHQWYYILSHSVHPQGAGLQRWPFQQYTVSPIMDYNLWYIYFSTMKQKLWVVSEELYAVYITYQSLHFLDKYSRALWVKSVTGEMSPLIILQAYI
jgi:hypothetical protein